VASKILHFVLPLAIGVVGRWVKDARAAQPSSIMVYVDVIDSHHHGVAQFVLAGWA
jgi:hypothetical protein